VTYRELNERANQLAHQLRQQGVRPDVLVGLCAEPSPAMIIGILAILKAGGAYVPIDLASSRKRIESILGDCKAPILLTQEKLAPSLPTHPARVICIDAPHTAILSLKPSLDPISGVKPNHLACVLYTAVSTGEPRGVMLTHHNVVRLFRATHTGFGFGPEDVWTLDHPYTSDFFLWEMWGALLYGGRLIIVPRRENLSPEAFYDLLAREHVTVLNQTPSAFGQLMGAEERISREVKLALRLVILGGEPLQMQSLKPWFDRHGDQQPQLVNMYGITEATVHVTCRRLSMHDLNSGSVIGLPIPDLQLYLLDPGRRPVPFGLPGEICVGGPGLAQGYLNDPELTREKFIPNPFSRVPGARLYRTGDLARFIAGPDLEYLGRGRF
jgi:amino acid adenylation domain-containing protein